MADPRNYRVTVKRPFVVGEIVFGPAEVEGPKKGYPQYRVPPEFYLNATLTDGTPFKDECATAEPEFDHE